MEVETQLTYTLRLRERFLTGDVLAYGDGAGAQIRIEPGTGATGVSAAATKRIPADARLPQHHRSKRHGCTGTNAAGEARRHDYQTRAPPARSSSSVLFPTEG